MDLSRYPEILKNIIEKAAERIAQRLQVPEEKAREAAFEVTEILRKEWSGDNLYLPKGCAYDISQRDIEMYEKFDGSNHAELGRYFGITTRQVYERLALVSAQEFAKRQPRLFPD